ncbi:MAG TPA: hypothetical protein VGR55_00375 [Candidatus Acidoferrum sp.]|nr:hypothetical protein [Candidatus Acidoferrum sp.]
MQKPKGLWMGARKTLTRSQAIEEYVILRLRYEDIKRLDYLLKTLHHKRIALPDDSPFSLRDLADTVRTCFFGWFATLTDRDDRAVYAFNCLLELFPHRKPEIVHVQVSLEACHDELQQFRNNVAFHSRAEIEAHFKARMKLRDDDVFLDLQSAISDFHRLMQTIIAEEMTAIPELPDELQKMGVAHHPAFSNVQRKKAVGGN